MEKKDETTFGTNQIVLYQTNSAIQLEVRLENETVWLSLNQMAELFTRDKSVISRHIKNIFEEEELYIDSVVAKFATTATDGKIYNVDYYNLDVIISVGYRVKSKRGVQFRQWATRTLKDYLLKGYAINQRVERLEQRVSETEKKIDFFVRTTLPPVEGIFYDGQIFDAYKFDGEVYHIGASLKDLGKKLFAFSKMGLNGLELLEKAVDQKSP